MDKYEPKMFKPDVINLTRPTPTYIYVTKLILFLVLLLALTPLGFGLLMATVMGLADNPTYDANYIIAIILALAVWAMYLSLMGWIFLKVVDCVWKLGRRAYGYIV